MRELIVLIFLTVSSICSGQSVVDTIGLNFIEQPSYSTVQGQIINHVWSQDQKDVIEIQVTDWTTSRRRQYFGEIDSLGNFSITFFIFSKQDALLLKGDKWTRFFIYPNDTLNVLIDNSKFPAANKYSGLSAQCCYEYQDYYLWNRNYLNNRRKEAFKKQRSISSNEFKTWRDSIFVLDSNRTENYIENNELDPFFKTWLRNEIYIELVVDLINYKYKQKTIHDLDTTYLFSIKIDTSLRYNSSFSKIISTSSIQLSLQSSKFFSIHNSKILATYRPDPEKEFPILDLRKSNEDIVKERFAYFLKNANKLNNSLLRQLIVAHGYTQLIERQGIDYGLDSVLKCINNPEIRFSLASLLKGSNFKEEVDHEFILDSDPGTALINDIIGNHEGHVLYLDFWGTWCSVCYSHFELINDIKKEFLSDNIKFIHLCCRCDRKKWEDYIKIRDTKTEHIFLSDIEFAYLSKRFGLMSVPKYIIVGLDGKIANMYAPTPAMKISLIRELKQQLEN